MLDHVRWYGREYYYFVDLSKKAASVVDTFVSAQISEQYHIMKW